MWRARLYLTATLCGILTLTALLMTGQQPNDSADKQQLVAAFGLTDLALFSEARYTRHPSQADLFTAFQDSPGAIDHFPSGSLVVPIPGSRTRSITVLKGER